MKIFRHSLYIASVGFLMLGSCAEKSNSETSVSEASPPSKVQTVEVTRPSAQSFMGEVLVSGTARPNQKVTVYAMESGYVSSISKDIGDRVKKGEVIARLSNPELSRQLEDKQALLEAKRTTYERLQSTYEKTPALTPLQMVEEAKAEFLSAEASVNGIKDRLSFLRIKAPFSGLITQRMVDNGALVQSGLTEDNPQGIFEVQEVDPIRLTIPLPESDIASISKGMEVEVSFPELTGAPIKAVVSRAAGVLDPASKTMQVEIDLENPTGAVKPGMYAKVSMQMGSRQGVLSLPVTAQVIYKNQAFVMVVKDGIVSRVPLRKGLASKDYFEVLNPEIDQNSLVIIQGKGLVQPGQSVEAIEKKAE